MSAHDHLSPQQFWDAKPEDEPGVAYHVSHPSNRESIAKHGLHPGRKGVDWPSGVYLHESLKGPTSYSKNGDLYKVNTEGLPLHEDERLTDFGLPSSYSRKPIEPSRVQRIGRRTPDGILFDQP